MAGKKRVRDVAAEAAAVAAPHKAFGPEAMGIVVAALRRGATVKAAAKVAGFSEGTVHEWRRKAPHFDAACSAALDSRAGMVVSAAGGREWQLHKPKRNAFTRRRKEIYLAHFAATCDTRASADAAGVSKGTVGNHRRSDPAFAAAEREALAQAYVALEAEAVRQRLAAMAKYRVAADEGAAEGLETMVAEEFDRTLGLLREHKRNLHGPRHPGRPPTKMPFAEAMALLEKRLKAFGVVVETEGEAREDDDDHV